MARTQQRSSVPSVPAHLAKLWDDPAVIVHRPARRKPFRPAIHVTIPVTARELIGRDREPEPADRPD
jgi:hypothetical protein